MAKIEDQITKKNKTHPNKLVKPIISQVRPGRDELVASEYIDDTSHNTPRDTTSAKLLSKSQYLILVLLKNESSSWT